MEHKARHRSLHLGRSLATSSAALQLGHPYSFLSLSAVRLQVSLGRLPSGVQVSATFWSSSFPFLSTCPMHLHLLSLMLSSIVWVSVLFLSSTFVILLGQNTRISYRSGKFLACWARGPGFDSGSRRNDFKDWLSPASKSRCGWNIAKAQSRSAALKSLWRNQSYPSLSASPIECYVSCSSQGSTQSLCPWIKNNFDHNFWIKRGTYFVLLFGMHTPLKKTLSNDTKLGNFVIRAVSLTWKISI